MITFVYLCCLLICSPHHHQEQGVEVPRALASGPSAFIPAKQVCMCDFYIWAFDALRK